MTTISVKDRRYPSFMRLVSLGRAAKGRFMYEQDGTKVIEFLPVSKTRRNPVATFGKDERKYKRAFKHYQDAWRMAWWREAIQNAVDARATRIDLSVERKDGYILVTAEDNGRGMDLEILQTKFLSEGATSKGADESGGFGVAKELLLMPWMEWYVETNGHWARGFREEPYEYDTLKTPRVGTKLSVKMSDKDGEHTDIEHAIAYIQKCYAPHIVFTCNGKKVPANLEMGRDVDKRVLGRDDVKVSYNAKSPIHGVFIRDGSNLFMFSQGTLEEGAIILTLLGDTKSLLIDSRMDFGSYGIKEAFDRFLKKLAVDVSSALKPPPEQIRVTLHAGSGKVRGVIDDVQADLQMKIAKKFQEKKVTPRDIEDMEQAVAQLDEAITNQVVRTTTSKGMVKVIMNLVTDKHAGENVSEAAALHLGHTPDVLVYNDCMDEVSIPNILLPGSGMGPKPKKLLRIWAEFCRVVLIRLGCPRPFGVGWCITKKEAHKKDTKGGFAMAMYGRNLQLSSGEVAQGDWLLLNPYRRGYVTEEGVKDKNAFYSLRVDDDLNRLFALAVHECTHMFTGISWHNEHFSSNENDIWTRNIPTSHLIKTIRDAVARKLPGERDDEDEAKTVETARSLGDLAESMRETYNSMGSECMSKRAIELKDALDDHMNEPMQRLTEQWLNRLSLAPKYSCWNNHIRQIVKHFAETNVDVFHIFLRVLETVPRELCPGKITLHELEQIVAYEAFQAL